MREIWFGPKRFGYGWSPANAKGWMAVAVYSVAMTTAAGLLWVNVVWGVLLMLSASAIMLVVALLTSSPAWPTWRWGGDQ